MKINKKVKQAVKQVILITVLLIGTFLMLSFLTYEKDVNDTEKTLPSISDYVLHYKPMVEKYAREYNVSGYVDVLLAMMMQESGGRGADPMQSSESYCGKKGCINDPELSIKQGAYYFSKTLEDADGDLHLAVQSYNFGLGFIDYVQQEKGTYSEEAAIDFSREMYENAPDQSIYTCLRKEAEQYEACYGDIYYVRSVMEYRDVIAMELRNW
ncbi:lysozyme family protein [Oceanobacillus saliphilus]|uniref:lysozyme family protein n=1 Tax=Oceanobacillus saliphilus TaxID=2925834 RepID=UPI00201D678C|nr:lysozyme family protein [Oceanobacillus saliphilus]